jgi:hypothetical protein
MCRNSDEDRANQLQQQNALLAQLNIIANSGD